MNNLKLAIWNKLSGTIQWYILWFAHAKFAVGVTGVIFSSKGKVLLVKHKYRRKHAVWGLPGGHMQPNETFEETLKREVLEETGYQVRVGKILQLKSGYKLRVEATYLGRLIGGELEIDPREVEKVDFFSPDKLPDKMLESHRKLIRLALNSK